MGSDAQARSRVAVFTVLRIHVRPWTTNPKRRLEMKFHLLISDMARIDIFCAVFLVEQECEFLLHENLCKVWKNSSIDFSSSLKLPVLELNLLHPGSRFKCNCEHNYANDISYDANKCGNSRCFIESTIYVFKRNLSYVI